VAFSFVRSTQRKYFACPERSTSPRMTSADGECLPSMMWKARSDAIACKPNSRPARMVDSTACGEP
jgi:hypothetical protein